MASQGGKCRSCESGLGKYRMLALAILAGAFIAMGANYATACVGTGGGGCALWNSEAPGRRGFRYRPYHGDRRRLRSLTGNCLIPMAWANNKVTTGSMLWNWITVYVGNLVGSVLTAYLIFSADSTN